MKREKSSFSRLAGVAACNLARLKPQSLAAAKELLHNGFDKRIPPRHRGILDRWAERWWNQQFHALASGPHPSGPPSSPKTVLRLSGVARGNLTRMKVGSREAAKATLRRLYGSKVERHELATLDRFADEWWSSHAGSEAVSCAAEAVQAAPKPITVDELHMARQLEDAIMAFFENGLPNLRSLAPVIHKIDALGGLIRAEAVVDALHQLCDERSSSFAEAEPLQLPGASMPTAS